jgi:hypothetical protein
VEFVRQESECGDGTMVDMLNSGTLRALGYLAVAVLAVVAGILEQRAPDREQRQLWPVYWLLTALVLLTAGIAHLGHLGDIIAGIGRSQARSAGWYGSRRGIQAAVVVWVSAVWFVAVLVAIWRVPPRRRRYLSSAIAVFTLLAFVAIRIVSLHQIDSLLYRRGVRGVRFVALIELTLLGIAAWTALVCCRSATSGSPPGRPNATSAKPHRERAG